MMKTGNRRQTWGPSAGRKELPSKFPTPQQIGKTPSSQPTSQRWGKTILALPLLSTPWGQSQLTPPREATTQQTWWQHGQHVPACPHSAHHAQDLSV